MWKWIGNLALLLFFTQPLLASVELEAPKSVKMGEALIFKIIARGFEISFPEIDFIEDELVEELKSSSEAYMIGTGKATQMTKIYKVLVKKDFTLPAFTFKIDGRFEVTKAHSVEVTEPSKTISDNYSLQMQINKTRAYLGEKITLRVLFTYKDLEDYLLIKPQFEGFLLKELSENSFQTPKGDYIEEQVFELFPKKAGHFLLAASKAKVEFFPKGKSHKFSNLKKAMVYSNSLKLDVKAVPEDIAIVGKYDMVSTVFNQKVKRGEAVKMRLEIFGEGNINNLEAFTFTIDKATVYSKNISTHPMQKEFEIIANEDFEIPSLSLTYFDTSKEKIMKIKSPSYKILVGDVRSVEKSVKEIEEVPKMIEKEVKEMNIMEKIAYILTGVLVTLMTIFVCRKVKTVRVASKESTLLVKLKKLNSQERFFKALIPFLGRDKALDRVIYKLEQSDDKAFKQLKVDTLRLIKSLKL